MTRDQHEWAAAHHGSAASKMASSRSLDDTIADSMDVAYAVLFAVTAAHHGRGALRCETCGGQGAVIETEGWMEDEDCPACDGTGLRSL